MNITTVQYKNYGSAYVFPGLAKATNCTSDYLILLTASHFKLTEKQIKMRSRLNIVCKPRQIAIYLVYHFTNLSLKQIAEIFNFKQHCNTIHSINVVNNLIQSKDKEYYHKINQLERMCNQYYIRYERKKRTGICNTRRVFT
jgi:chromosomal replication initiation ATPase DnaA